MKFIGSQENTQTDQSPQTQTIWIGRIILNNLSLKNYFLCSSADEK